MLLTKVRYLQVMIMLSGLVYGAGTVFPAYADNQPLQESSAQSEAETAVVSPSLNPEHSAVSYDQSRGQILASLPHNASPRYLDTLSTLYAARAMQPLWQERAVVKAFEQQLAEVAMSGVQPQFARWVEQLTDPALTGMGRDIVLSDAMLGYLDYLAIIPERGEQILYGSSGYKMKAPSEARISQWQNAFNRGDGVGFLASLAPKGQDYQTLQKSLVSLMAQAGPWPQLVGTSTLRPGQVSSDIPALHSILSHYGMLTKESGLADSQPGSSVYNQTLVEGVKRFQRQQGLEADGVIGAQTRAWLNTSPQQRAAIIALNIQRLHLLPESVNTGIMVNIPDYSLVYYLNGDKALQSRVIVGRPDRKTPLMRSALNNVVVNPPWNVPQTLARKDILPKVRQDPGYLERRGYTIFRGWSQDAQSVDPFMVDWSTITENNLPFRFQQKPGAQNSLGRYKFNMPNSEAIYLHDTPNHNLFGREQRALSSGCVRVNKAAELADMLLEDNGWNRSRIASALDAGNTRYVAIRQQVPVTLYYLTAFSGNNGQTAFRTDIYNYDRSASVGANSVTNARLLIQ